MRKKIELPLLLEYYLCNYTLVLPFPNEVRVLLVLTLNPKYCSSHWPRESRDLPLGIRFAFTVIWSVVFFTNALGVECADGCYCTRLWPSCLYHPFFLGCQRESPCLDNLKCTPNAGEEIMTAIHQEFCVHLLIDVSALLVTYTLNQ